MDRKTVMQFDKMLLPIRNRAGRREIFSAAIFQHVMIFSVDGNKQAEEDAINKNQSQEIIRFLPNKDVF